LSIFELIGVLLSDLLVKSVQFLEIGLQKSCKPLLLPARHEPLVYNGEQFEVSHVDFGSSQPLGFLGHVVLQQIVPKEEGFLDRTGAVSQSLHFVCIA